MKVEGSHGISIYIYIYVDLYVFVTPNASSTELQSITEFLNREFTQNHNEHYMMNTLVNFT